MDIVTSLGLAPIDLAALAWFLACTLGYNLVTGGGRLWRSSLIAAIHTQRSRWMAQMAERDDRVIDVILISNLATGNTFFASTSVIILGALASLLGSGERAQAVIDRIPFTAHAPPTAWDVKILVLMVVFVYAFFKFAWAFRLAHYGMIMVGATPSTEASTEGVRGLHAARTARVAGIAAEHGNLGMRAYYFAMAGIGWFFHPIAFLVTTTLVVLIITRREYFSRTLATISDRRVRTISTLPMI